MNTKECRHCRQPIHEQARICQHCKGNQGWFANQTDPRFTVFLIGAMLLIFIPLAIWLPDLMFRSAEPKASPNLVVAGTTVHYAALTDGTRVLALGQVRNESQAEASRIWMRLELFDASGQLIDTVLQEQSGLIVPQSGAKPFRITAMTTVSPSDVKRVVVTVERARERGKYD